MRSTELLVLVLAAAACAPAPASNGRSADADGVPADSVPGEGEGEGEGEAPVFDWQVDDEVEHAGGGDATELFQPTVIHEIELELGSSARNALSRDPRTYVDARFIWNGLDIPVGVRLKGSSSMDSISGKPSMKVDFNHVVDGVDLQGQKKLNLHNMAYDPMKVSEELTYRMWRDADLPASRTSYARITLDGSDYGLYSVVETPDDPFLKRWYDDADGNLYENAENYCDLNRGRGCFEAEEFDEGSHEALDRFIEAATSASDLSALTPLLDWERYTGFLAMEASIAHWDSYSYDQSNYRWYHEPSTDTWSLIPSSVDLGFGYRPWSYPDCGKHGVTPSDYTMGLVSDRCWSDADCEEAVLEKMLSIADQLDAMDAAAAVRAASDRVRDAVYDDRRKYTSDAQFEEHVDCVEAWLSQRPDEVREWVADRRD